MKMLYQSLIEQSLKSPDQTVQIPLQTDLGRRQIHVSAKENRLEICDPEMDLRMLSYIDQSYSKKNHTPLNFNLQTKTESGDRNGIFFGSHFYDISLEYFRNKNISCIEGLYENTSDTFCSLMNLLEDYYAEYDKNHALNPAVLEILQSKHWSAKQAFRNGFRLTSLHFYPQDTDEGKEFPPESALAIYTPQNLIPVVLEDYTSLDNLI